MLGGVGPEHVGGQSEGEKVQTEPFEGDAEEGQPEAKVRQVLWSKDDPVTPTSSYKEPAQATHEVASLGNDEADVV
jgi:hypothetical protein